MKQSLAQETDPKADSLFLTFGPKRSGRLLSTDHVLPVFISVGEVIYQYLGRQQQRPEKYFLNSRLSWTIMIKISFKVQIKCVNVCGSLSRGWRWGGSPLGGLLPLRLVTEDEPGLLNNGGHPLLVLPPVLLHHTIQNNQNRRVTSSVIDNFVKAKRTLLGLFV